MKNANRPANPVNAPDLCNLEEGLSKREHFAIMAMQRILTNESWMDRINNEQVPTNKESLVLRQKIVLASIITADELLLELENTKQTEP